MLGKIKQDLQQDLFKTRLTELINMEHPLVKLAHELSWDKMESEFERLFSEGGRPSIAILKIAGMLLLKKLRSTSRIPLNNKKIMSKCLKKAMKAL